jgi:hypothetical protein
VSIASQLRAFASGVRDGYRAEREQADSGAVITLVPTADSLPEIEDDWPAAFKECVIRQRIVTLGGECVCGASHANANTWIEHGVLMVHQNHALECAAHESNLCP